MFRKLLGLHEHKWVHTNTIKERAFGRCIGISYVQVCTVCGKIQTVEVA